MTRGGDVFGKRLIVAGVTAVLIAGLGACGGGGGGGSAGTGSASGTGQSGPAGTGQAGPSPTPDAVSGLRDQVRHVTARTTRAPRPHMVRRCTTGTRRVSHTSSSGTGSRRRTHTSYTTEHYQHCTKVRSGTETYKRLVRPERWCVSLDDVDRNTARDDVWYQVDRSAYDKAVAADEHAPLTFVPKDPGC
ncbi:hypothetical protein ACH41H_05585 [Streptomyces sp. NPDC020800]|uniref:hypothetical protein n=1 Tax=Streptomyces sp. NPDC020800 TaxID=3365092 RepID=UPI00378900A9